LIGPSGNFKIFLKAEFPGRYELSVASGDLTSAPLIVVVEGNTAATLYPTAVIYFSGSTRESINSGKRVPIAGETGTSLAQDDTHPMQATFFSSSKSFIKLAPVDPLAQEHTISVWYRVTSTAVAEKSMLFGCDNVDPGETIGLNLFSYYNKLSLNLNDSDLNPVSHKPLNSIAWQLMTIRFDGTDATLFIDGVRAQTAPHYRSFAGKTAFVLGNTSTRGYGLSGAFLAHFAVWNHALPDKDIRMLYESGPLLNLPELI
jgi:hypothetical protein